MMFSEFQQGTGCRDNEYNHKVYRDLEVMYMNSDYITKEQIYEYGRKLVDNSDTPEQVELKKRIAEEIKECDESIKMWKNLIKNEQDMVAILGDPTGSRKRQIRGLKNDLAKERARLKALKWVIEG